LRFARRFGTRSRRRLITKPLLPAQQLALVEEVARMVEEKATPNT